MKGKILSFIIIIGVCAGLIFGFAVSHSQQVSKSGNKNTLLLSEHSSSEKVATKISPAVTPGIPLSIAIPKINVQAAVESVGMDSQGRMDVPKDAANTAWYSPGFKPGMQGSAVIDGHLDRVTGAPAVFWNLKELVVGDIIQVREDNGRIFTFSVDRIVKYPDNAFPIKEVFGASDVPMLNLITCNGVWDKNAKNYSDRLVVYSKLVSEK